MEITGSTIRIESANHDEKGHRIELEQKLVDQIHATPAPVTGSLDGKTLGNLKATINVQTDLGTFANGLRSMCSSCKHFDHARWLKLKDRLEYTKEGLVTLNAARQALMETGNSKLGDMHESPEGTSISNMHLRTLVSVTRSQSGIATS